MIQNEAPMFPEQSTRSDPPATQPRARLADDTAPAERRAGASGRAVFVRTTGGPDVLEVGTHPIAAPRRHEVMVEIRAAGVAFGDQLLREGLVPGARLPAIPGYDAAGVVVAVGSEVTDLTVGAPVAVWTGGRGGYATHITVPAWAAVAYPADLDPQVVASMILNYLTAYQLLTRAVPVADGATILVHPAAGGVGSALLELGALRGLRMFGTASAAKAQAVSRYGAEPIDYRKQDYAAYLRRAAPAGIDAIFDGIGGGSWRKDVSLLRPGGHLAIYGVTEGLTHGRRSLRGLLSSVVRAPRTSYLTYLRNSVGVTGFRIDAVLAAHPTWYREDLSVLLQLLQDGQITPPLQRSFPLEQAAQAHRELGSGRVSGKIVLLPHTT